MVGCGEASEALAFARFHPSSGNYEETEAWNGTSWTEVNDLSTGRFFTSGSGTQSAGLVCGGRTSPSNNNLQTTEEFNAVNTVAVD